MADYDSFNYDIQKRLPEWYKHSGVAESVNIYTQDLISNLLNSLLSSTGVAQPLNCWLTIPEEYDWFHHYYDTDDYLEGSTSRLYGGETVNAILPNTKRNCHAHIRLKLLGNPDDIPPKIESEIKNSIPHYKTTIDKLILQNGNQTITFNNIENTSTIEINTKTGEILIDGQAKDNLIDGSFENIQPVQKYLDYQEPDIDKDGNILETSHPIGIEHENKITKISIKTEKEYDNVEFDLQVRLYNPTYTTEQNIRVATVSAFPIERIELYGFYCHPFNNKQGYKFLWQKEYCLDSRTVFDRITKQFDCERFYIKVKFYGIGTPLVKGFPQEELSSEFMFQPNPYLDKWGRIYGLPRRAYRTDISQNDESKTFPKYYTYPIEQDYWYEERMINEYRLEDEAINSIFVKDSDFNNIMNLECIYPYMNDIWVYTETLNPDETIIKETDKEPLHSIIQDIESAGVEWESTEYMISDHVSEPIILKPHSDDIIKLNDYSYQTKMLKLSFDLSKYKTIMPHDIEITGIELIFDADTNANTSLLRLTPDSCMILPYYINLQKENNLQDSSNEIIFDRIDINQQMPIWNSSSKYIIGGKDYLFGLDNISRDQLLYGNNGKVEFEIGFINENTFLEYFLRINKIYLKIYYKEILDEFDLSMSLDKKSLIINEGRDIEVSFDVTNKSNKDIFNKRVYVVCSEELKLTDPSNPNTSINGFDFNLEKGESFTAKMNLKLVNQKTGKYDIIAFCDDKVFKEEILVKSQQV